MKFLLISIVFTTAFFLSCNKKDIAAPADPCANINYTITSSHTESIGNANDGTITILEPRGDTITYKLGNSSFQSSWYFTNLAPGNYVVTIKNQHSCTDTTQITILNYGPKYAQVKQLITGYCGPCHLGGTINGGMNFDTDARIISAWDRIKIRAVDNLPTQMPELPNSPLTPVDKQKIIDWVNAGHRQLD